MTDENRIVIPGQQRTIVFLFVCSANVARSATAEHLARQGRCIADSVGSDPSVAVRRLTVETHRAGAANHLHGR
jgi:protein-tyrosine-phosphatase